MNVLYINYLFDKKYSSVGAAVHVAEFTKAARDCGLNIKSCDVNKFSGEEQAAQSKVRAWLKTRLSRYVGQLNALLSNLGYFRREWQLVNAEKPDALLVRYNLLNFSAPLIAKLKRLPLVLEVNSPMALENREFNSRTYNLPLVPEWAEKLNLRMATRVYTVSEALKEYFVKNGIDEKKISVVPNGVNIDMFRPDVPAAAVRERYNLSRKVVVGFVGSFHYWHGVEYFPEYVRELAQKHDNVHFLFVGNGPLRENLEAQLSGGDLAEGVSFAGYVAHDEMPAYLAAMDIVVAPYPPMQFFYFSPLKIFEYMAAGKAVVASRVGQIEELVQDGTDGYLFEPGDMAAFAARTSELIAGEELRKTFGKRARDKMCQNYSWRKNAERVAELLKLSMNGRSGRTDA